MNSFITWGVIGALCAGTAVFSFLSFWLEPERARKRRARANQKFVRKCVKRNGMTGIEEEAELLAKAREELKDPWTYYYRGPLA